MIGAQCYLLHSGENYYARLSFWLPKLDRPSEIHRRIEQYFSIGVLHNHSFDFFTVGLLGSGYRSSFYCYNGDDIDGVNVGDKIELSKVVDMKLGTGEALFVSKSSDFHVQYEPEDFSVSLNIIPKTFDKIGSRHNAQLIIDIENLTVHRKFTNDPRNNSSGPKPVL